MGRGYAAPAAPSVLIFPSMSKGFSSFVAAATGGIYGLIEAWWLRSHSLQLPGSGDPWLLWEGIALYAVIGFFAALLAFVVLRSDKPVVSMTAPLCVLLLMIGLFQINTMAPGSFFTFRGICFSLLAIAVVAGFFWVLTKLLGPAFSVIRVLAIVGIAISLGVAFVHSPLHPYKVSRAHNSSRPNIVFITMDTTRADHLTPYRYFRDTSPFIAKLAAQATLFENAYSVSSWTLPSHSSIFTGRLPSVHGAIYTHWWLDSSETTLAEILQKNGYSTAAFVSGPFLLPSFNIQQGFEYYDDQLDLFSGLQRFTIMKIVRRFTKKRLPWIDGQRDGKDLTDHVLSWMQVQQDPSPFFLFVNYFDPHDPYRPPAPFNTMYDASYHGLMNGYTEKLFKNRQTGERIGPDGHPLNAADYHHLNALYDGEIRFMDQQIGRLFTYLQNHPYWKNTIVVLMADHGESIGDHHLLDHGHTLYEEQIHIPLIILGPGIPAGKRVTSLVRSIDLLPFLLERIHLPLPSNIQGTSFAAYLNGASSDRRTYIGEIFQDPDTRVKRFQRNQKSIRDADWKLLWSSDGNYELYDLAKDPKELLNQNSSGVEASQLHDAMFQYLKQLPQRVLQKTIPLDESTLENLEANSYIN